jgi:hypothetical protein
MPVLQIEHPVRDFEAWRRSFDRDPVGRAAGGVRSFRILRPVDDPGYVLIELDFETEGEAASFLEKLRAMWVEAGPRLGFESPRTRIVEVVETASV